MASKPSRRGPRRRWRVAAIQMTSTTDVAANAAAAERLVRRAAAGGAALVALPENVLWLRAEGSGVGLRVDLDGPELGALAGLARELGIWLLVGSVPERVPRSRRIHNTSVLLDPDGRRVAVYRKIHLFDIAIPGGVELTESRFVKAGLEPVTARTPLGGLGLSVCYDLRFPELYRRLAFAGADVLFVPAAFTAYTGPHHWLPLLRARAIENQCWVVAPAQSGRHDAERASHGETAVVDPWGRVVARKRRGTGIVAAEIDLGRVDEVRRGLPCLEHARPALVGARRRRTRRL